jgi:non-specific protein-tyrosine kinase
VLAAAIRSPRQLAEITGAPVLGTVAAQRRARRDTLVADDGPYDRRAEALRKLRTNLRAIDVDATHRAVLVTSPVGGDGGTATACNLAITLARGGARVLLVDADLRRPRVASALHVPGGVGLTNVLTGTADLDEAIHAWREPNLWVLPSGPVPDNPSELVGFRKMNALLTILRGRYDVVVIDAPPVLPVADAAATAAVCDGVLLVVRYGATRRDQVEGALAALRLAGVALLGCVLNGVPAGRWHAPHLDYRPDPSAAERIAVPAPVEFGPDHSTRDAHLRDDQRNETRARL